MYWPNFNQQNKTQLLAKLKKKILFLKFFGDRKTHFFYIYKLKCCVPFALTTALSQCGSNLKFPIDNVDLSYYMNSDLIFLFLFLFHFLILFSGCVPFSWSRAGHSRSY